MIRNRAVCAIVVTQVAIWGLLSSCSVSPTAPGNEGLDGGGDDVADDVGDDFNGGDAQLDGGAEPPEPLRCVELECPDGGQDNCVEVLRSGWCLIGGECFRQGEISSNNSCQYCNSASTVNGWSRRPDGVPCESDNPCTWLDRCEAGVCRDGAPTDCPPPGACRGEGTCVPEEGGCVYPPLQDGLPCGVDDAGQCVDGSCEGAGCVCTEESYCCDGCEPRNLGRTCGESTNCASPGTCTREGVCLQPVLPNFCFIDLVCYRRGRDNPEHSCEACDDRVDKYAWTPKEEGATCHYGVPCFDGRCEENVCIEEAIPVQCEPQECQVGACNPENGQCEYEDEADGTPCGEDGTCQEGDCQ